MRRSELEIHLDILRLLARSGPLKLTHVMHKANVCCSILKEYLDLLMQYNLVEKRTLSDEKTVYAITQRGLTVLKHFRQLCLNMPIAEEHQRIAALLY